MYGANTIVRVYIGPNDKYTYEHLRKFYHLAKRRWKVADVWGADEVMILENNRRHANKYQRSLSILGWITSNKKYLKIEKYYQGLVGDPYYEYFAKFSKYVLTWWGLGSKFVKKSSKKDRNIKSIPNTPMFDPSIHFDKNSIMEKIYMQGMSYDDAMKSTFKGKAQLVDIINGLTDYNKKNGMSDEEAYADALRVSEIVSRNLALDKNAPMDNQYSFLINYYNKFIDATRRIMMPLDMNLFFIKEALKYNPNLSLYVLSPDNNMHRIQGVVGERCENIMIAVSAFKDTKKYDYEFVYSYGSHTLFNHAENGFVEAKDLKKLTTKTNNLMYGSKKCKVEHRYDSEYMYDLILEGTPAGNYFPWVDALHNVQLSPDYSKKINLDGKDIIV